ncbi:MAG TPA: glutathione S-transferase family protein [Burkholderiales bacterium]|nr:glutathione S-transferase family protein [Burkholderiales bacterium]
MPRYTLVIGNRNYSSWSLRAWLLMKHSGIGFEEVRVPLYVAGYKAALRRYAPSGKVPVLLDAGLAVWDSLAIAEYLAERHPDLTLWPADTVQRAAARSISAEMHSGFAPLRSNMSMNCRGSFPGVGRTVEVAADIERIQRIWTDCRERFGAVGPYLFGAFTIPDAMYAPVVLRFKTYAVQLTTAAQEYADAILALPELQEWIEAARAETEVIPAFEPATP